MIDSAELIDVRMSAGGERLQLKVRDQTGQTVTITLPACWLNAILNAIPRTSDVDTVHPLDTWSMNRVDDSQDLVLTLRTPEGQAVSFAVKPWQVEGMATIATYGKTGSRSATTIH